MKINFTKREYPALVELLQLADRVIHAHEEGHNTATTPYL
jgi:hypothetical protein